MRPRAVLPAFLSPQVPPHFRTEHLRHGVDIRTLQSWMGHRDIKSTMVYLKGVQSKDALAKVNAGALARYVA